MLINEPTFLADYDRIDHLSVKMLRLLRSETVQYGALAAMLTAGRLQDPETRMSHEKESQFLKDGMDWLATYFAIDDNAEFN